MNFIILDEQVIIDPNNIGDKSKKSCTDLSGLSSSKKINLQDSITVNEVYNNILNLEKLSYKN